MCTYFLRISYVDHWENVCLCALCNQKLEEAVKASTALRTNGSSIKSGILGHHIHSQLHFTLDICERRYGNVNADAFGLTAVLFMQLDCLPGGIYKQSHTQGLSKGNGSIESCRYIY